MAYLWVHRGYFLWLQLFTRWGGNFRHMVFFALLNIWGDFGCCGKQGGGTPVFLKHGSSNLFFTANRMFLMKFCWSSLSFLKHVVHLPALIFMQTTLCTPHGTAFYLETQLMTHVPYYNITLCLQCHVGETRGELFYVLCKLLYIYCKSTPHLNDVLNVLQY